MRMVAPSEAVLHELARAFSALGWRVGRAPLTAALCALALCGTIAIVGVPLVEATGEYEEVWYPTTTEAWADHEFQQKWFGKSPRTEVFVVVARGGRGDALAPAALAAALALHDEITSRTAWRSVCARAWEPDGPCLSRGSAAA